MNDALATVSSPAVPIEVQEFAIEKGLDGYLDSAISLARQAFPSSALYVSIGQDAESEMHRYIALDVEVSGQTTQELLAGQRLWSAGISRVCPSRLAVYFVLGWQ
jgi:hypothetical protein